MSAVKRSLQDHEQPHDPAQKRLKSAHTASASGLGFLLSDSASLLTARLTNGVADKKASRVDDSRAVILSGQNETNGGIGDVDHAISVSSREEDDEDEQDEDEEQDIEEDEDVSIRDGDVTDGRQLSNGINGAHDEASEEEEQTFGDMLRARHPDIITVAADEPAQSLLQSSTTAVTGHSLGAVLQQALKTNDKHLLESCFALRDVPSIKNTIQRLPSPLIDQLLTRIAERMHKRPGRASALMVWVQWSLVAHGGYLAGQPIMKQLSALNQVIKQRAQGLQPLLQLKGKLDMLHAQLELRKGRATHTLDMDADEEAITYRERDIQTDWGADVSEHLSVDEDDGVDPAQQQDSAEEEDELDVLDMEAEVDDEDVSVLDEDEEEDDMESDESGAGLSEEEDEEQDNDDDDDEAPALTRRH